MIDELIKLGEKIKKIAVTVNKEIWYWKSIRYFVQNKELQIAANLIFEQLATENYLILPQPEYIITAIKGLGLEQ
jgi:hypothetical protein